MNYCLQELAIPSIDVATESLFWHGSCDHIDGVGLRLAAAAEVSTDTYFNGFSLLNWRTRCEIRDLEVEIEFKGRIDLTVLLRGMDGDVSQVARMSDLDHGSQRCKVTVDLGGLPKRGLLYCVVTALDETLVQQIRYVTRMPPRHSVNMEFVVTHFRREAAVESMLARIVPELGSTVFGSRRLTVVDNSQSLEAVGNENVAIVANRNLGGSGGFMRGLREAEKSGQTTHVVFMDDDAACELCSFDRVQAFMAYVVDGRTAVCGAMFAMDTPSIIWESGAYFFGRPRQLRNLLDAKDPTQLLELETPVEIGYGGWWLFSFPINAVSKYAFPFFVRGDDVNFSMCNEFTLVDMCGVGSWQEHFFTKNTPQTYYLDCRSHMLHKWLSGKPGLFLAAPYQFCWLLSFCYHYSEAEAVLLAFEHVLEGPEFFENNADMSQIFPKLRALSDRMELLSGDALDAIPPMVPIEVDVKGSKDFKRTLKVIFSFVMLGNHLFPRFLIRNRSKTLSIRNVPRPRRIMFCETVYEVPMSDQPIRVRRFDRRRFLAIQARLAWLVIRSVFERRKLKRRYQAKGPYLMSRGFWDEQFGSASE